MIIIYKSVVNWALFYDKRQVAFTICYLDLIGVIVNSQSKWYAAEKRRPYK